MLFSVCVCILFFFYAGLGRGRRLGGAGGGVRKLVFMLGGRRRMLGLQDVRGIGLIFRAPRYNLNYNYTDTRKKKIFLFS